MHLGMFHVWFRWISSGFVFLGSWWWWMARPALATGSLPDAVRGHTSYTTLISCLSESKDASAWSSSSSSWNWVSWLHDLVVPPWVAGGCLGWIPGWQQQEQQLELERQWWLAMDEKIRVVGKSRWCLVWSLCGVVGMLVCVVACAVVCLLRSSHATWTSGLGIHARTPLRFWFLAAVVLQCQPQLCCYIQFRTSQDVS